MQPRAWTESRLGTGPEFSHTEARAGLSQIIWDCECRNLVWGGGFFYLVGRASIHLARNRPDSSAVARRRDRPSFARTLFCFALLVRRPGLGASSGGMALLRQTAAALGDLSCSLFVGLGIDRPFVVAAGIAEAAPGSLWCAIDPAAASTGRQVVSSLAWCGRSREYRGGRRAFGISASNCRHRPGPAVSQWRQIQKLTNGGA
jgi:hypothetical protein